MNTGKQNNKLKFNQIKNIVWWNNPTNQGLKLFAIEKRDQIMVRRIKLSTKFVH